ncbi:hypothetical protein MYX65_10700 [Acidobacteria bacterium AH-259-L09]|nr:hypothetical protein [Acidobacteria bacterium AH-259-L09]
MSITKKELQQILSTQTKEFKGHTDKRFRALERNLRKEIKLLATKEELLATKEDLSQIRKEVRLLATKEELLATKEDLTQQIEGLAAMVNRGFDDIKSQLDIRKTVREHGRKILRLERALNIKL